MMRLEKRSRIKCCRKKAYYLQFMYLPLQKPPNPFLNVFDKSFDDAAS